MLRLKNTLYSWVREHRHSLFVFHLFKELPNFTAEYHKAYPNAKIIGVKALIKKREGVVSFDGGKAILSHTQSIALSILIHVHINV